MIDALNFELPNAGGEKAAKFHPGRLCIGQTLWRFHFSTGILPCLGRLETSRACGTIRITDLGTCSYFDLAQEESLSHPRCRPQA